MNRQLLLWCLTCLPGNAAVDADAVWGLHGSGPDGPYGQHGSGPGQLGYFAPDALPTRTILAAKLLGALARLRIWLLLFLLTLLQGSLVALTGLCFIGKICGWKAGHWRPLSFFVPGWRFFLPPLPDFVCLDYGIIGHNGAGGAYTAVILMRLFNNTPLWLVTACLNQPTNGFLSAATWDQRPFTCWLPLFWPGPSAAGPTGKTIIIVNS
jgi:hypothetical protein